MAALTGALRKLWSNPKTAMFAETLRHSDLPSNWANDPEIVGLASEAYKELGTESPFFKAWFRQGMTDDAGQPLKMYHGTPAQNVDDWAFNPKYIGRTGTVHGSGFYTTTDPYVAEAYKQRNGNILELFSNMQRPLDEEAKSLTLPQLKRVIKQSAEDEARNLAEEEGERYTKDKIRDSWISGYTNTYNKTIPEAITDAAQNIKNSHNTALAQIEDIDFGAGDYMGTRKAVKDLIGYDGVTVQKPQAGEPGIYVQWFPEQLKATSNRGTFNPADPNIYRGLIPMLAGGGALAAMSPGSAQASEAEWPKQAPDGRLVWPADMPGYRNTEPGLEAPLVDPVDIATAPIGMTTAAGKALAMAAEPGLAYGTDKALGALLGLFQRNKRTGGGGGV